jgi:hypothetical protein
MGKQIDRIDIVFENCEVIQVPMSDVRFIWLGDIKERLFINNICYRKNDGFELDKSATQAKLIIKNKPEYERVNKYSDITHIDFMRNNKSVSYIGIKWLGESEYHNVGQEVEIVKDEIFININIENED